ncbi:MAG: hypothetical protein ACI8QF_003056 [Limisphaerales bacterium]|jgi:hypothetical protein
MSFKLPDQPSPQADVHELADFAELWAWKRRQVSVREILGYLGRIDENDFNEGCDDSDDINADLLDETMNEVERRSTACGSGYPFLLTEAGTVLRHQDEKNERSSVYNYLLLSTRMNMKANRSHGGIDGAGLLEEISAFTIRNYLGADRCKSIVFGTARAGGFKEKIEDLCKRIGEGGGFRHMDPGAVQANDDKLDTVAWIPFSDKLPGKLVVFGQCKTGSSWDAQKTQLQPDAFIKLWMREGFVVDPMRAFFVSEAVDRSHWRRHGLYAGLFFDRCRIVDCSDSIDPSLISNIENWNTAAIGSVSIG